MDTEAEKQTHTDTSPPTTVLEEVKKELVGGEIKNGGLSLSKSQQAENVVKYTQNSFSKSLWLEKER